MYGPCAMRSCLLQVHSTAAPLQRSIAARAMETIADVEVAYSSSDKLRHEFYLYNTMSGRKEKFQARPGQGNKVNMYCCGVTVYDYSHIGTRQLLIFAA